MNLICGNCKHVWEEVGMGFRLIRCPVCGATEDIYECPDYYEGTGTRKGVEMKKPTSEEVAAALERAEKEVEQKMKDLKEKLPPWDIEMSSIVFM